MEKMEPRARTGKTGGPCEPEIFAVTVNNQDQEIKIIGEHFGTDINDVKVTLATFGELIVKAVIDTTMIIAQFPAIPETAISEVVEKLPAGDYVLTVEVNGEDEDYGLTIGAVGPQGPPGLNGVAGKDGADGEDGTPGTNGQNGSSCSIKETIVSCTDGTSYDVEGPPGEPGSSVSFQPVVYPVVKDLGKTQGSDKNATASCIGNDAVVGGGFNIHATNGPVGGPTEDDILDNLMVRVSEPQTTEPQGWIVVARQIIETGDSWGLIARALCLVIPDP